LFSKVGLVDGISTLFWPLLVALIIANAVVWVLGVYDKLPRIIQQPLRDLS